MSGKTKILPGKGPWKGAGDDTEKGIAKTFMFLPENTARIPDILDCYPAGHHESAVMPLLTLAQRQIGGWLTRAAMNRVAEILGMAPIRVYEVGTFYSMYNLAPVGKNYIQICTTTPCWLRGSDEIVASCRKILGIDLGETSEDGEFTMGEVECLGACVNAPMLKINDDYYEDLDPVRVEAILTLLKNGDKPQTGSQSNRHGAAPARGLITLREVPVRGIGRKKS